MTTHKNSAEANRLAALQLIADGNPLDGVHPSTLRALESKALARRRGEQWELLPEGRALINKASGISYYLQMQYNDGWIPVLRAAGQPVMFDDLSEAETAASSCSIVNLVPVRVVEGTQMEPESYPVYDFGRRYIEHAKGGRSAAPRLITHNDEAELQPESYHMFVVQRRSRHWANNGMFVPWVMARPTRFAALEDAIESARTAAAQDTDAYEYRILIEDMPELPPIVYVRDEELPDLGILDVMCAFVSSSGGDERTRKARSIGIILATWAIQADLVIESCRVALTAAAEAADMTFADLYQKLA